MRYVALLLGAALLVAPPVAEAKRGPKPLRFAPKRAPLVKHGGPEKGPAPRGWRPAARTVVVTMSAPTSPGIGPPPPAVAEDAPVVPAGAPADAEESPAPPSACDPSPWLGAIAEDVGGFRLRLTRTCVPAGRVLFQFRNTDLAEHNLWAEGVAPAAAAREVVPGTRGQTTVTASATLRAGRWRLFCSFEGHEAMSRLVEVTPPA